MKIEVGKTYITRDGFRYRIAKDDGSKFMQFWDVSGRYCWMADGQYYEDGAPNGMDLVAECVEPHASELPGAIAHLPGEPDVYNAAAADALNEVRRAKSMWPGNFNSAHEGFAITLEEFDELRAHVWTNQKRRDLAAMRKEAIQVAAMALRFAAECCDEVTGRR